MAHAVLEEPQQEHMGLPLPNGKLAMWLFLVTEIMFFTGLIGTYLILRNGTPSVREPWPTPHDVHLVEWIGAFNTFVLICSSLTVVLAHSALGAGNVKRATLYIAVTLGLGLVFLGVKAVEYSAKFEHDILPGRIFEKLEGPVGWDNRQLVATQTGARFKLHVKKQLEHITSPTHAIGVSGGAAQAWEGFVENAEAAKKKNAEQAGKSLEADLQKVLEQSPDLAPTAAWWNFSEEAEKKRGTMKRPAFVTAMKAELEELTMKHPVLKVNADAWLVLDAWPDLSPKQLNERIVGTKHLKPIDKTDGGQPIEGLLEKHPALHLAHSIPYGNLWASCYFAMTGFHAIHVFGGLVVFTIMLVTAWRGRFGRQHETMVELTGLYWHFVDIVWIFLFPLLYLV
jgi:cytochrome c oxidase subunit 3